MSNIIKAYYVEYHMCVDGGSFMGRDQKLKQDICLGGNIGVLRAKAGLTQEEVAARWQVMGIDRSRNFYAQIEGGTYNIKVSELVALRKIFRCTFEDFFQGID